MGEICCIDLKASKNGPTLCFHNCLARLRVCACLSVCLYTNACMHTCMCVGDGEEEI